VIGVIGIYRQVFFRPDGLALTMFIDKKIDTSGLNCPLPILKAKKALNEMSSGQVLQVVATDPGAWRDFEAFARQTGNDLLMQEQNGDRFVFALKRR
jgi:tRNA 2-thiouridine synthesizing protein A